MATTLRARPAAAPVRSTPAPGGPRPGRGPCQDAVMRLRPLVIVVLATLGALTVAACSGSSGSDAGSATTTAPKPATVATRSPGCRAATPVPPGDDKVTTSS